MNSKGPWTVLSEAQELSGRVRTNLRVTGSLRMGGFTMSGDTGVFTLLDVGLGLQADGDSPTVRFIVKCDLKG